MKRCDKLGCGTYGVVYSAISPVSNKKYAVKRNLAATNMSGCGVGSEVDILNNLRDHPHIVTLERVSYGHPFSVGCFSPISSPSNRDDNIHFVFDEAAYDLHRYIYGVADQDYDYSVVKRYMLHILLGVEYMHQNKIIHRDLKPSNILIFGEHQDIEGTPNVAKLCDFGLAKPYTYQVETNTCNVVTPPYRAPEITLDRPDYDYRSDVWSLGCIFFEMVARKSFIPLIDESNDSLLSHILCNLPVALTRQEFKTLVVDNLSRKVKLLPLYDNKRRRSFRQKFGFTKSTSQKFTAGAGNIDIFCDLLHKMLTFNWDKRYTVKQCLDHEFFDEHRDIINLTRSSFPLQVEITDKIVIRACTERKCMAYLVIDTFNRRDKIPGYSHRALFQAMDLYDRYLAMMFHYTKIPSNAVESSNKGFIHDKFHSNLRFFCCFYLALKYFSSIQIPFKFDKIVPKEYQNATCRAIAEKFESDFIIDCLEYNIYRDTLYEYTDDYNYRLTDEDVKKLIILYSLNNTFSGMTHKELCQYYHTHLSTVSVNELVSHVINHPPNNTKKLSVRDNISIPRPVTTSC